MAGDLPFLVKLLAADRPLSLQVHPNRAMALAGFEAEESAGTPLDSPQRTYKDPHHKPEMAYALTTFDTLVGFRPTAEILRVMSGLDTPLIRRWPNSWVLLRASPASSAWSSSCSKNHPPLTKSPKCSLPARWRPNRASTSSAPT